MYPMAIPNSNSMDMKMSCIPSQKKKGTISLDINIPCAQVYTDISNEQIDPPRSPCEIKSAKVFRLHSSQRTATVPKIAPLAPRDGDPTSAKLAPRTFLHRSFRNYKLKEEILAHPKIPAAK